MKWVLFLGITTEIALGLQTIPEPLSIEHIKTASQMVAREKTQFMNRSILATWQLRVLVPLLLIAMSLSGCSNFDARKKYWDQTMATTLKGATRAQLKSFAASHGHEAYIFDGAGSYFVDQHSKGAMGNSRGRLFVMFLMNEDRVASHWFETTVVLY
jgi:hypothetical protein